MTRYVIVPGYGGLSDGHWQLAWAEELGDRAVVLQPSSWDQPELSDWVGAVDRAVAASHAHSERIMLIAHSLGCWAVSAWCATADPALAPMVMMVAPPDRQSAAFPREDAGSFLPLRAHHLNRRGAVVYSEDDPYCTATTARSLADNWDLKALNMGKCGHLNAASALGRWEEGRHIRDGLLPGTSH